FPDVPACKRQKQLLRNVTVNDGLHMHGVLAIPRISRLKTRLNEHVRERWNMYQTQKMYCIHVEPIDSRIIYTTDYAGKAFKTPRFDQDDVLILPKTTGELETGRRVAMFGARKLRDLQSRYNISDEVACALVHSQRLFKNIE